MKKLELVRDISIEVLDTKPVKDTDWREVVQVHPAVAAWPRLSDGELDEIIASFRQPAATFDEPVVFWYDAKGVIGPPQTRYLIDGQNRLDALQRARGTIVIEDEQGNRQLDMVEQTEVTFPKHEQVLELILRKNAYRRHMTKQQKAEAIEATLATDPANLAGSVNPTDGAKLARSVKRGKGGQLQGSTKSPARVAADAALKAAGISERTGRRARAKTQTGGPRGSAGKRAPEPAPKAPARKGRVERPADLAARGFLTELRKTSASDYTARGLKVLDSIIEEVARINDEQAERTGR